MTVYELTLAAVALMRQNAGLGIHQAITRAADASHAPEEVVSDAFRLANLHASLTRFRAQMQADELLAHLNEAADEIDALEGERLPVRREQGYVAN